MEKLVEGYRRFRADIWPEERKRYEHLAACGQRPPSLVIACSDSRVDPQTVFGAGPGELFMVRNVAGLVPRYAPDSGYHGTSAALEYAVRVLHVARIVVLGHAQCGGVRAMIDGPPVEALDFVGPWMAIADTVRKRVAADDDGDRLTRAEIAVVQLSLENLRTFPWIADAVAAGRLRLHGCWFDIRTGTLAFLEGGCLVPVE